MEVPVLRPTSKQVLSPTSKQIQRWMSHFFYGSDDEDIELVEEVIRDDSDEACSEKENDE